MLLSLQLPLQLQLQLPLPLPLPLQLQLQLPCATIQLTPLPLIPPLLPPQDRVWEPQPHPRPRPLLLWRSEIEVTIFAP